MLDDHLIKQIEFHLAGVTRASDQYGVDTEYMLENDSKNKQIFDLEGYDKYLEAKQFDKMTSHEKQEELLLQSKIKQNELDKALKMRQEALVEFKRNPEEYVPGMEDYVDQRMGEDERMMDQK